jgi:hypothetical protein
MDTNTSEPAPKAQTKSSGKTPANLNAITATIATSTLAATIP